MAISPVLKTAGDSTEANNSYQTAAVAPTGDRLYVLVVQPNDSGGATEIPSITGFGLTWEVITSVMSNAAGLVAFRAMGPSPSSGQITISFTGTHESVQWALIEFDGVDTSGTNGSGAIVDTNIKTVIQAASQTSLDLDLDALLSADNYGFAAFSHQRDEEPAAAGTLTQLSVGSIDAPDRSLETQGDINETDGGISWVTAGSSRGLAFEIRDGAGGGTPPLELGWAWRKAGLDGGGGVNAMCIAPNGINMLEGGDISALHRSTDSGATWDGANRGLTDGGSGAVIGGLTYADGSNTICFAGTKDGFYRSDDNADNWDQISTDSFGEGGGTDRPRQNCGTPLLAVGDYIFFVNRAGDLKRYRISTDTLTNLSGSVNVTGIGEGIALWPFDATGDTLLVGTRNGLWKISDALTTPSSAKFNGTRAPARVNEVKSALIGSTGHIWVSAHGEGVLRMKGTSIATSDSWFDKTPGTTLQSQLWAGLDLKVVGSSLWVGAANEAGPSDGSGHYRTDFVSFDGEADSPVWTCITQDNADMDYISNVGGASGPEWWGNRTPSTGGTSGNALVFKQCDSEGMAWSPTENHLWRWGQQGTYRYDFDADILRPMFRYQGVTANTCIYWDSIDHILFVNNTDHVCFFSEDFGNSFYKNSRGMTGSGLTNPAGFDMTRIENLPGERRYYLAYGHRSSNTNGGIYFHAAPENGDAWVKVGSLPGNNRPFGVATRRASYSGTQRDIIYAMVEGGGICRAVATTAAVPSTVAGENFRNVGPAGAMSQASPSSERMPIAWLDDDTVVAWDLRSGVYLTKNARATNPTFWKCWDVTNDNTRGQGFLAIDNNDPDVAYFSIGAGGNKGVFRVTGFLTAANGDVVGGASSPLQRSAINKPAGSWSEPGPLDFRDGQLVVMDGTSGATPPQVYYSENDGATLEDIADDVFERNAFKWFDIAMAGNYIFLSNSGPGVVMAELTLGEPGTDQTVNAQGFAETEAFGTPSVTVTPDKTVAPTSLSETEAFGSPTLTRQDGRVVDAFGIEETEAFGSPTITQPGTFTQAEGRKGSIGVGEAPVAG